MDLLEIFYRTFTIQNEFEPRLERSSRSLSRLYKRATRERCSDGDFRFDDELLPGKIPSNDGSRAEDRRASAIAV